MREQALKLKQDIENITNKNYTVESGMKGLSDKQQQARTLLHVYIGDLAVKILVALVMLIPFRLLLKTFKPV